jgi:hypothetical protein
MIVGSDETGYDYYSYSSEGVDHLHSESFSHLVGTLQEARMADGDSAYDRWQRWETNLNQDDGAREQVTDSRSAGDNYDLTTNNCWLMVRESLDDANCIVNTALTTAPNENFNKNLPLHGGLVDSYNLDDTSLQIPE